MNESNVDMLLQQAYMQHKSGNIGEALRIYDNVLSIDPELVDPLKRNS